MSTTPQKGRADYLELGTWNVACAECGRKRKAHDMRQLPPGVPGGGMWVCFPEHWNSRQPQDYVRGVPDKMAAPYVQQQVESYPLEVQNVDSDTTTLEIEIDTAAAAPGSEPLIINVFEGVTLGTLTITDVSGGVAAASIVLNNYGIIEDLINDDNVSITQQGNGHYPTPSQQFVLTAVQINATDVGKNTLVGSVAPSTYLGSNLRFIVAEYSPPPFPFWNVYLYIDGDALGQNYFTTFTLNGQTFLSSAASYSEPGGGYTTWQWGDNTDNEVLPGAADYNMEIL
jgi:hypothetical protein